VGGKFVRLLAEINMAKIGKTRKEKPQIKIESNQSRSDESEAKGGMDMDGLIGVKYCLLDPPLLMFVRLLAALITNILYSFKCFVLCRSLQQTWLAKGKNVDLK
jgi:hypothetical protein